MRAVQLGQAVWEMGFPSDGEVDISARASKACGVTRGFKHCGQVLDNTRVWCVPKNVTLCTVMELIVDSLYPLSSSSSPS